MEKRGKELLHYILPSAGALCVTYLYNIVDGIFVGRGVGHLALAAVNISVPFITTLVAVSVLFGMGRLRWYPYALDMETRKALMMRL